MDKDEQKGTRTGGIHNASFVPDETSVQSQYSLPRLTPAPTGGFHGKEKDINRDPEKAYVASNSAVTGAAPAAPERQKWDNQLEFLLSCIAMSVGLGNIWRFPFIVLENGGGAFLIPYLIVLTLIGRPMYYLEMCLGQFCSKGQVKAWSMVPFFKGIGYLSTFSTFATVSFYCVLISITILYLCASFSATLPWSECNPEWVENGSPDCNNVTLALLYFIKDAVPQKDSIVDGLGTPNWRLSLTLLLAWILVCATLIKGVKSSGKVAYFTAIFPYVVLLILLIRGVTLPGAKDGIIKFFKPDWSKLYDLKVWYAAVGQCFFSLNVAFGPVIMFSSYNPFRHNASRDVLIITFMDTITSLLTGITVFSILGNLAYVTNQPIDSVLTGGAGLAFIAYPSAIASFDWAPQLFGVLFFLMLFTLGLGSATSMIYCVVTVICDAFTSVKTWQATVGVGVIGYLVGLMYIGPGGIHILDLVDNFAVTYVVYIAALVEVTAIAYIYGFNNFCADVEFMLKHRVHIYYKVCWAFVMPVGLTAILVYWLVTYESQIPEEKGYPRVAQICAWVLYGLSISMIPAFGLHAVFKTKGAGLMDKFRNSFHPKANWGPADPQTRAEWVEFKKNR